jgi:hypothetical protein
MMQYAREGPPSCRCPPPQIPSGRLNEQLRLFGLQFFVATFQPADSVVAGGLAVYTVADTTSPPSPNVAGENGTIYAIGTTPACDGGGIVCGPGLRLSDCASIALAAKYDNPADIACISCDEGTWADDSAADRFSCAACTRPCPAGQREISQCAYTTDRRCAPLSTTGPPRTTSVRLPTTAMATSSPDSGNLGGVTTSVYVAVTTAASNGSGAVGGNGDAAVNSVAPTTSRTLTTSAPPSTTATPYCAYGAGTVSLCSRTRAGSGLQRVGSVLPLPTSAAADAKFGAATASAGDIDGFSNTTEVCAW